MNPATPSKMHINSLENKFILKVFSYLPISDLCRLNLICKKWANLQSAVCAQSQRLSIQVNIPKRYQNNSIFSFPHLAEVENAQQNLFNHNHNSAAFESLSFARFNLENVSKIVAMFPSINQLEITIDSILPFREHNGVMLEELTPVVTLIESCSKNLQIIYINIRFCGFSGYIFNKTFLRLVKAINSCFKLEHLTCEIKNSFDWINNQVPEFDLTIVKQLKSFYWNFPQVLEQVWINLHQYNNLYLQSIGFGNICKQDLETDCFKNEEKYKNLFSKIHFFELFHIKSKPKEIAIICQKLLHIQRFHLCVNYLEQLYSLVTLLKPLKQLFFLELYFYLEKTSDDLQNNIQNIPDLESVQIFNLHSDIPSHETIQKIKWEIMFPNLEVLILSNIYSSCKICMKNKDEDDGESKKLKCIKLALQGWKKCTKLKKIYCVFQNKEMMIDINLL